MELSSLYVLLCFGDDFYNGLLLGTCKYSQINNEKKWKKAKKQDFQGVNMRLKSRRR